MSRTAATFSKASSNHQSRRKPANWDNVIGLNNSAVVLLGSGKHEEAMELIEMGLQTEGADNLSLFIVHSQGDCSMLDEMDLEKDIPVSSCSRPERPSKTTKSSSPSQIRADSVASPSNHFSVYNRAFLLPETVLDTIAESWKQDHASHHIHSVLLYNIGLANHRIGLETGKSESFKKALAFYMESLRLIEQNAQRGFYNTELDMLLLALYNNMGYIYSHFCMETETIDCYHRLLALFLETESRMMMGKDDYIFFYLSVLFLHCSWPVLAPAA